MRRSKMAYFKIVQRRRRMSISDVIWMAIMATMLIFFMVVVVFYGRDDDLAVATIIQNRQILSEKEVISSREEKLLEVAADLERELRESRERISRRLEVLGTRREEADVARWGPGRERGVLRVVAPQQRVKRRLMDARTSRGLGREVGLGLYDDGDSGGVGGGIGPGVLDSNNSSWDIVYRAHKPTQTQGVKDHSTGDGSFKNAPENGLIPGSAPRINLSPNHAKSPQNSATLPLTKEKNGSDIFDKALDISKSTNIDPKSFSPSENIPKSIHNSSGNGEPNVFQKTKPPNPRGDFLKSNFVSKKYRSNSENRTGMAPSSRRIEQKSVDANVFTLGDEPLLNCEDLARVNSREPVGSGYTKRVERAKLADGRMAALKSVWEEGNDVVTCKGLGMARRDCIRLANYKLLKEIALLQQLRHPNIIKLLGFCVKDDESKRGSESRAPSTVVIEENGTPLAFLDYLQMPWEERFRVCYGLSNLLAFLADSPLGSLAIHDFKMSQFVLVDGQIKLADLDDVDDGLRPCSTTIDCSLTVGYNFTVHGECREGVCANFGEISNTAHAHSIFYALLQFDAPNGLGELVGQLLNHSKGALWSAGQIARHMDYMLAYYRDGKHLNNSRRYDDTEFRAHPNKDLVGTDDYWCPGSRQLSATCVLSVYDAHEATDICAKNAAQCRAFVLTSQRTWTGRRIAYFKKGVSTSPQTSEGSTLYILER